jgi:predicted transposase/invertase (TIGR01784 family)
MVLQKNEFVLRGLIGSLLHLSQDEIKSIVITNPIKPGEQINSKTFILDIHITMNDDTLLDIEMQVVDQGDWPDRSLSYLCRMYDQLFRGEEYSQTRRAIHIGILDFTLFPEAPEFYACYKMANVKNHHIFSDKLILHVLDLTQTKRATQEDQAHEIVRWAQLFTATTWEELRMIAEDNKYMSAASAAMYELNADDIMRQQCEAREEYNRHERWMKRRYEKLEQDSKAQLAERDAELAEKDRMIAELQAQLAEQQK